jgi:hypothetical protein
MKATLVFNTSDFDERKDFERAVKATNAFLALYEIHNSIFRPNVKHGYNNNKINELLDKCGTYIDEDGYETNYGSAVICELQQLFFEILEDNSIDLDMAI